jgi:hypothetical protein
VLFNKYNWYYLREGCNTFFAIEGVVYQNTFHALGSSNVGGAWGRGSATRVNE